jgi:hypothetical protein
LLASVLRPNATQLMSYHYQSIQHYEQYSEIPCKSSVVDPDPAFQVNPDTDVHATEEVFSPQKKTSSISKN